MTDGPQRVEGDSTWSRLRRGKVVQWGITYAAGAWGLLQGLAYIIDTFHWPEYIQQSATLLLLIGLPIALVIGWYHGDREQQRPVRNELAIIALLLLLGGGALWLHGDRSMPTQTAATSATPTPAPTASSPPADRRPSIAVLPFENRSRLEDDTFFVDGIHDDILTQLTKIGAMRVIARTSVEQFRDTNLTTREIGEQLGVGRILEGGVQRAGDRVRVTVQLIDAATDAHLWAENYDRELTAANIFAIQSEVATAIAAALKANLTPAEQVAVNTIPTRNLDAWEAYQLGRQRMAKRTSEGLANAELSFRKAADLDPKFALAYAGLADTLALQVVYSGAPEVANLARAEQALGTALQLDPNLAEAWAASANVATLRGQHDRVEPMLRRAIDLNPNYATAYQWYGGLLMQRGDVEQGFAHLQRAAELDPLSVIVNQNLGVQLARVGRFDEAGARFRKVIEIDREAPFAYLGIGLIDAYVLNRYADAVALVAKAGDLDPGNPFYPSWLVAFYLDLAHDAEAFRILESAQNRWPGNGSLFARAPFVHMYRGDLEAALRGARRLLALDSSDPDALRLLRDDDLRTGHAGDSRARYETAYPELLAPQSPSIRESNWVVAVDLALVLQMTGDGERASLLLDHSQSFIRTIPRMGPGGYKIGDAQVFALRGQKREALAALRAGQQAGWRADWRYYRDFDPTLASIRNEPEFAAVFADIERDMARQRAELAARPKDAPLDL